MHFQKCFEQSFKVKQALNSHIDALYALGLLGFVIGTCLFRASGGQFTEYRRSSPIYCFSFNALFTLIVFRENAIVFLKIGGR